MSEQLLIRAVGRDQGAFRELVDPYRRELQFHCYRILGSMQDAEDALQETLLAAWSGIERFEGRASLRAWLYRIATNCCLDAKRQANRRPPLEAPFVPHAPTRLGEAIWLEPYPDALLADVIDIAPGPDARYETKETVELAFIVALQQLPPRQRSALLLRDVLGFRASEVAEILGASEDAVKSALKRARETIVQRGPAPGRTPAPLPGSEAERRIVQRFSAAFEADDIDGIVAMLTEDAWMTMPPSPLEYQGPAAIAAFLRQVAGSLGGQPNRLVPTRANTQPAFGCYRTEQGPRRGQSAGLMVLTLEGDRISAVTRFLDNSVIAQFGLPPTLPD